MNKKKKAEINAFYEMYKIEKGEKMFYKFKCEKCGKAQEIEIARSAERIAPAIIVSSPKAEKSFKIVISKCQMMAIDGIRLVK